MGTHTAPGDYDPTPRLADDEPCFMLVGKDPTAAACITVWAHLRKAIGRDDPAQLAEARECALAMLAYATSVGRGAETEKVKKAAQVIAAALEAGSMSGALAALRDENARLRFDLGELRDELQRRGEVPRLRLAVDSPVNVAVAYLRSLLADGYEPTIEILGAPGDPVTARIESPYAKADLYLGVRVTEESERKRLAASLLSAARGPGASPTLNASR